MNLWRKTVDWLSGRLGGRERMQIIFLLAMALGLDGADLGAIGAMSSTLQQHFSISKSQIGLLISASKGIGIFSTLFFGSFVDRTRRTRLLAIAVALWGVMMIICGAATSFMFLLMARLGLGAVSAATLPCTASLIGDYFPGGERGKIYGYVLSGEMIGTGIGFILSGEMSGLWWRLGFWILLVPAIPLAWWINKLPEPKRGAQNQKASSQNQAGDSGRLMAQKARQAGIPPRERLVRDEDPEQKSIWWAIRYVLSVPTNAVLIISSALGYAFFSDVRTFGIEFAQSAYHLNHSYAVGLLVLLGIGALSGVWVGGRLGDRLLAKGHLPARVWVATFFFWTSVVFFFFGFFFQMLWLSIALFICSSFSLGAVNPPLDSARLDIIHPKLWGRAESVRMILRNATEAVAPISFGWLVAAFSGPGAGMRDAFMIMLVPLGIAGAIAVITFRTYPPDAAAASAYRQKTMNHSSSSG